MQTNRIHWGSRFVLDAADDRFLFEVPYSGRVKSRRLAAKAIRARLKGPFGHSTLNPRVNVRQVRPDVLTMLVEVAGI